MLYDAANSAGEDVSQALRALVEAQFNVMMIAQQSEMDFIAALNALVNAITAPRRLIEDAAGNPIGVVSTIENGEIR